MSSSSSSSEYQDADDNPNQGNLSSDKDTDSESGDSIEYRLDQLFDLVEFNKEDELLLRDLIKLKRAEDDSSSSTGSQATRQRPGMSEIRDRAQAAPTKSR